MFKISALFKEDQEKSRKKKEKKGVSVLWWKIFTNSLIFKRVPGKSTGFGQVSAWLISKLRNYLKTDITDKNLKKKCKQKHF